MTSKLWNTDHHPSRVEAACRETLAKLQLKYLDLYLIHWPMAFQSSLSGGGGGGDGDGDGGDAAADVAGGGGGGGGTSNKNSMFPNNEKTGRMQYEEVHFVDTWEAMENLVRKGLVKSIGISNFNQTQIEDILNVASITPQVLQIENHP